MRIFYGQDTLHDPSAGVELLDVELVQSLRESSSLVFKMPRAHPAFGRVRLASVDPEIEVWEGGECLMRGRAVSCEDVDDVGTVEYSCEGELAYLNDVSARPYSTVAGAAPILAPSDPYGYFSWLIAAYNSKVEPAKQMEVGVNQGHLLDDNDHILRSDSTYPSIGAVVREKLLEKLGGFVRARYSGGRRYVDYLADTDGEAAQRIEFGANLLSFARTRDGSEICSAVIPLGKAPDDSEGKPTVEALPDGDADSYGRYLKRGDAVVSVDLAAKVGYRETAVEWPDVAEPANLLARALEWLPGQANEIETLTIDAFDLSKIDAGVKPINLGDYVRVTSMPHGYDSYMIVSKIVRRPCDARGAKYTFGVEGDDIGDLQRKHAAELNAGINGAYEAAKSVGEIAKDAQARADDAQGSADAARDAADKAKAEADKATADAIQAAKDALDAKHKADDATAKVEIVETDVTVVKQAVAAAQGAADAAGETAGSATAKADAANKAATDAKSEAASALANAGSAIATADAAQAEAADAKADAAKVRADLAGQIKTVTDTMAADYSRKTDLTQTEAKLIAQIERSAAGVTTTVAEQYAKKTDLTTVESGLQTQIKQAADGIEQTARAVATVDAKANDAASAAAAAGAAASKAQTDATAAKSNATAAQTAADAAAKNLAIAEANLDTVSIRVGATEADVKAAEAAVAAAKSAADAAQSAATTAKANAETARATADAAKTAAASAQAAADALGTRMTAAETSIKQTGEQIKLAATKAEVATTLGGYYTKSQADAAIKVSADAIESTVSSVKAAADAAKLAGEVETLQPNMKVFKNVASVTSDAANLKGALVITTPITPSRMIDVHIYGYNYVTGKSNIDIQLGFYNYAGSMTCESYVNKGDFSITPVRVGKVSASDTRAVIVLGDAGTVWQYPKIVVGKVLVGYGAAAPDGYKDGFAAGISTAIPALTHEKTLAGVDVKDRIVSAESSITQLSDRITSTVSETTKLGTRMTTVEQTASGLSVSLGNTDKAAAAAKTAADAAKSTADAASAKAAAAAGDATAAKNSAASAAATANAAKTAADTAKSTADTAKVNAATAQSAANAAKTAAADAAKTATNYMEYTSSGLDVGNKTSGKWAGFRTRMASTAFQVLDAAGAVLASYGASVVELGKNAKTAVVKLCGGIGEIAGSVGATRDLLKVSSNGDLWIKGYGVTVEGDHLELVGGSSATINGTGLSLLAYPVGAVYQSFDPTSPAALFGGTWAQITGRFLYCTTGTGTGGSNTHTLTASQMPPHAHTLAGNYTKVGWSGTSPDAVFTTAKYGNFGSFGGQRAYDMLDANNRQVIGDSGGGGSHNNMPAYQGVYAWRRTA